MNKLTHVLIVLLFICTANIFAADAHPLVGTWKRVAARQSKDGEWRPDPADVTMLKHITGTHVSWAVYRNDSKEIIAAMGGGISIDGEKYIESVEHGLGTVLNLLGKKQNFIWKVEGNKFIQAGTLSNGVYLEEQFERVPGER